ncbi:MAG: hypothetical protein ACLTKE_01300 [Coprococcus sp.]
MSHGRNQFALLIFSREEVVSGDCHEQMEKARLAAPVSYAKWDVNRQHVRGGTSSRERKQ